MAELVGFESKTDTDKRLTNQLPDQLPDQMPVEASLLPESQYTTDAQPDSVHTELAPQSVQSNIGANTPEKPASHPDITEAGLTLEALAKVCPYWAAMREKSPELAQSQFDSYSKNTNEDSEMRQRGASEEEIKSSKWAAAGERFKQKMADAVKESQPAKPGEAIEVAKSEFKPSEITKTLSNHAELDDSPNQTNPTKESGEDKIAQMDQFDRLNKPTDSSPERPTDSEQNVVSVSPDVYSRVIELERLDQISEVGSQTSQSPEPNETVVPTVALSESAGHLPKAPGEQSAQAASPQDEAIVIAPKAVSEAKLELPVESPESRDNAQDHNEQQPDDHLDLELLPGKEVAPEMTDLSTTQNNLPNQVGALDTKEYMSAELAGEADSGREIYDNFTVALRVLSAPATEEGIAEDGRLSLADMAELPVRGTVEAERGLPAIVSSVALRLAESGTETTETLVPVVTDVAEATQLINQLEIGSPNPETVQAARDKLAGAVAELLEQLNIDYESADVEQFIAVILRPDFVSMLLPTVDFAEFDLEKDGTHEAKKRLVSAAADLIDGASYSLERLLGVIMLIGLTAGRVAKAA